MDQRIDDGGIHITNVHPNRIRYCGRVIQGRVVRLEGQIEVLLAGGNQCGIRFFPYQAAVNAIFAIQNITIVLE